MRNSCFRPPENEKTSAELRAMKHLLLRETKQRTHRCVLATFELGRVVDAPEEAVLRAENKINALLKP